MRSFASSDLKQMLGDVLTAASREPVTITKHSKPRYVLMTVEDYEQRVRRYEKRVPHDERRAIATSDMPAEHLEMLEASLEDSRSDT